MYLKSEIIVVKLIGRSKRKSELELVAVFPLVATLLFSYSADNALIWAE